MISTRILFVTDSKEVGIGRQTLYAIEAGTYAPNTAVVPQDMYVQNYSHLTALTRRPGVTDMRAGATATGPRLLTK